MLLTVATEDGATFNLDLDGSMEVETLAALLEADVSRLSLSWTFGYELREYEHRTEWYPGGRSATVLLG
jgi:hypothetical protein